MKKPSTAKIERSMSIFSIQNPSESHLPPGTKKRTERAPPIFELCLIEYPINASNMLALIFDRST